MRLYNKQAEEFIRMGKLIGTYPETDHRDSHRSFVYDIGNGVCGHYNPQLRACDVSPNNYTGGFR